MIDPTHFVEIRHAQKSFGDLEVLKDISLTVERGQIVGIIGASGSGKSTLLRAINDLDPLTGGEVWLDGVQVNKAQMDKATFGYRLHFRTHPSEDLAAKTVAMTPEGLDRVFFVSGGSEAVESAVKLARQYALTQGQGSRTKVISRFPSYQGCTFGALDLTGYDPLRAAFAPLMAGMPKVAAPATYLDRDTLTEEARGLKYAEMLRDKILEEGPETVLAFIMEPVGGASTGALVAPDSYYGRIREICDEFGVLLIYDEVMTGAGRTGKFLAAEHWGITPDIVALSKGFGAGYAPLGAILAGARLVEPVLDAGGFLHGFTYAGNPLACGAGLAVLEEMEDQGLIKNAARMGEVLMAELRALMADYAFIGDVRGKGLLTAFEFVSDRATMAPLEPALNAYDRLVELAYERGLIIYSRRTRGGTSGDHFLLAPPLIITAEQIAEMMTILREALDAFAAEVGLPTGSAA
ncbi:aminotransferase class III-fold pyridoxal phosphate-dependent enzyme [Tropicibacter naphthalenivorans]|uniref:Taurine--pyruvate aminotransferase n=1 Tax=Tropicibacter naphthalenivorans TaxID=441103 RepID=A0A0P1GIX5_9RHOB|nr:aminotransferase class III-fold pyridoxal phosphate-dependent enzyme [Tropicibacter naphthalenivorans]CUH82019.1 Taurine--pyruvate aminotransferase [Tropicibacter naphthalenivorans]SMD07655.1 Adenosylmethionine-8-amino-7-oxononanoate aminotransferase [Tropicibacter naphthalenivorans]